MVEYSFGTREDKDLDKVERFLAFDLGEESYAIHLLTVREVIPQPKTRELPNVPQEFVGIMNLRGQIISIIDLRKKLKIKPKEKGLEEAVIIVDIQGISIGFIVDSINKVLNFSLREITNVPEIQSQISSKYIEGVYQGDDKLFILLNIKSILNIDEIRKLSQRK